METYAWLNPQEFINRLAAYKNDAFCNVSDYDGSGMLMCTRDGYNAMIELAQRLRESMPVPDDYSIKDLLDGIRKYVVRAIVDEKKDDLALSRLLGETVKMAVQHHVERTYRFPCVIVHYQDPPQFRIGIVTFTSGKTFPEAFKSALTDYVQSGPDKKFSTEEVEKFQHDVMTYGWIASVTVPRVHPNQQNVAPS